jgi:arabinose-5-phosphate isomerase
VKALQNLKKIDKVNFAKNIDDIKKRQGKIITTGIGKSAHIARKMAASLSSLGQEAFFVHPSEAMHGDSGMVNSRDIIIALSYSGESAEVVRFAKHEKKTKSVKIYSICGKSKSSLAMLSDGIFEVKISKEGSPKEMAPMSSLTVTLVMCDMITSELVDVNFKEQNFAGLHPGGLLGLKYVKVKEIMHKGDDLPLVKIKSNFKQMLQIMTDKKMGLIGIVDSKDKLSGILTDGDLRRLLLKHEDLCNQKIEHVINKNPSSMDEDSSLYEALKCMEDLKITNMFVTNKKNKIAGVVHIHDILSVNLK